MSGYQAPATLPVTTTGGWARPGWRDIVEEPEREGRFGPADRDELFDDYATLAIADQERCGLDIVTDGEHRRLGWIEGMTAALPGHPAARAAPPARRGRLRHAVDLRARAAARRRSSRCGTSWASTPSSPPARTGGRASASRAPTA